MSHALYGLKNRLDNASADINLLFITDSTGESYPEWVGYFLDHIAADYPGLSVVYYEWWDDGNESWTAGTTVQAGTGPWSVNVWNGGGGGYDASTFIANDAAILQYPDACEYIIVALGHNGNTDGEWDTLIGLLETDWPDAHITISTQNPPASAEPFDGTYWDSTTVAAATRNGWPSMDVEGAFVATGDVLAYLGDTVHPNDAGRELWGDYVYTIFEASMTIAAQSRIIGDGVLLTWTDTTAAQSYTISISEYDLTEPDSPTTRTVSLTTPDILSWFDDELDAATDQVTYTITGTDAEADSVTVVLEGWPYGEIDYLESSIRYTTLALVKSQLGILSSNTERDTELTQAIISAESWIDNYCGRSFPDPTGGKILGIPERVKRAALLLSVGFYTEAGGMDADPLSVELRRQQASDMAVGLLYGYRVEWGVA